MSVEIYAAYAEALTQVVPAPTPAPYNWIVRPNTMSPLWMAYNFMLDEFARELANSINDLGHQVHQLSAWELVVSSLDDDKKMAVGHEFVDALATHALLLPYVIKSRFAFAISHLSHQANRAVTSNWVDDFPLDRKIDLDTPRKYAAGWTRFAQFKDAFDTINGGAFQAATRNFRHVYNHRFSPRIILGITNMVVRSVAPNGGVSYGFGGQGPLGLPRIVTLLNAEREACGHAFAEFQALVAEQIEAIAAHPSQTALRDNA